MSLTALRWRLVGERRNHELDLLLLSSRSIRRPMRHRHSGYTNRRLDPEIGKVLTAVVDAGAAVVGFDLIFPSSIEESDLPFGQELSDQHNRGFRSRFSARPGHCGPDRQGRAGCDSAGSNWISPCGRATRGCRRAAQIYAQSTYSSTPTGLCEGCRC